VYANTTAGINVEGLPAGTPSGITIKNNVSVDNAINCPDGARRPPGRNRTESRPTPGSRTRPPATSSSPAASPAIDMADSSATGEQTTDLAGNPRADDPSTQNTGVGRVPTMTPARMSTRAPGRAGTPGDREPSQRHSDLVRATTRHADQHLHHLPGHQRRGETPLATVSGPTTQYTDSAVTVSTAYYYQVTATNSSGTSARSTEVSAIPGGAPTSRISFRAASKVSLTSGVTQMSIGAPAGVQAGDVMVAWLALSNSVSGFSFGSGWTPFSWSPPIDGTTYQVFAYYKVATAADADATYTASWTSNSTGTLTIAAYSGVDNAARLAGSAGLVDNNSSTGLTTPSLATSAPTSWAVALYSTRSSTTSQSNNSWTPDPALTERVDANNSAAGSSPWAAIELADSAAAVTTSPHSCTAVAVYPESHEAAALVYLRQAPSGVGS
jgi:hypothetical protein